MNEPNPNVKQNPGAAAVIVARHVGGITLNDYEFLLDDEKHERKFSSEKDAIAFLHSHNVTDEEIDCMTFFYWSECPFCGVEVIEKTYNAKMAEGGKIITCSHCKNKIGIDAKNEQEE